jgi:DNA (cytosine-5)-methyltransferase 1
MRQLTVFDELIIDNFAGGGGASTGIEAALGRIVDIAINHNAEAVEMHKANHPHTKHYCEDVWSVDPLEVTSGKKVALAWFSPDCKHFSKAKGAAPREKKIRGLAWVAIRWAATVKPRVIVLENVEEFVTWGPLTKDGQPCPKRKGQTFRSFKNAFIRLGYQVEHRELIAYEYGTPTTRKRFFMIARCDGQPIVWPTPTHGKPSNPRVKSGELKPWRTAAECIDWSIPCPSIFERERPLAEATLRRIAKGIQKYVIDAKNPFIVTCNHSGDGFRGQGLSEPFKTVTSSRDAHGLVVPTLVQTGYGERPGQEPRVPGLDKPLGTAMAQGIKHGLVAATLMHYRDAPGEQIRNVDLEAPLGTVTAGGVQHALAVATLLKH